jgi:membrane-associated phospholipid phosphatase
MKSIEMKEKIATYISVIGHPLLTIPLFVITALFSLNDFQSALSMSLLIVGGIFVPLTIKTYLGYKKGTYTNFDVSNQAERQSWYSLPLVLLLIVTVVLFATHQPKALKWNTLYAFILLLTSQLINFSIKSSLHVSCNIFLSFLMLSINWTMGISFLAFVVLVAWSRLILKRHTFKEILAGTIIGFIIGLLSLFTT